MVFFCTYIYVYTHIHIYNKMIKTNVKMRAGVVFYLDPTSKQRELWWFEMVSSNPEYINVMIIC